MTSPGNPAETRAYILERLVGDTGEPDSVVKAGRSLAQRASAGITDKLNDWLSAPVEIELDRVELTRMAAALPAPETFPAVTIAASAASPDALLMSIDAQGLALLVSALFGADPDATVTPFRRPLTVIELDIATVAFQLAAEAINGSGPRALQVRFPLAPAISGPEIAKQVLRDGPAVEIIFAINAPGGSGRLTIAMPQRVLMRPRDGRPEKSGREAAAASEWSARFGEEVKRSTVTVDALVPIGAVSLGSVANWRPGQILEIPQAAQGETRLAARDKTLFVCEFGKLGQNYTVRVKHPFDAGQDLMDGIMAQ